MYVIFGKKTGLALQAGRDEKGALFATFIRARPDGSWEKFPEGKTVKFHLGELRQLVDVFAGRAPAFSAYHSFNGDDTPIKFTAEGAAGTPSFRVLASAGGYLKPVEYPESAVAGDFLRRVYAAAVDRLLGGPEIPRASTSASTSASTPAPAASTSSSLPATGPTPAPSPGRSWRKSPDSSPSGSPSTRIISRKATSVPARASPRVSKTSRGSPARRDSRPSPSSAAPRAGGTPGKSRGPDQAQVTGDGGPGRGGGSVTEGAPGADTQLLQATVARETAKAYLLAVPSAGGREVWVPKSAASPATGGQFRVKTWILEKKGLVGA